MRRTIALLLLAAFVAPYLLKVGTMGYWLMYRPYIAQEYCINKDKPQLKCDGKCYLTKKLQQTETTPATPEQDLPVGFEQLLKAELAPFVSAGPPDLVIRSAIAASYYMATAHAPYADLRGRLSEQSCFHPPEV